MDNAIAPNTTDSSVTTPTITAPDPSYTPTGTFDSSMGNAGSADDRYANAMQNNDPKALLQLAADNAGTGISAAALSGANSLYKTSKQLDDLTKPIIDAGGMQTPDGRLAVAKVWHNNKDEPQFMNALIESLAGNHIGARLALTGGTVKQITTYDRNGQQLLENIDETGMRQKVTDINGRAITPQEYQDRMGGQTQLANTMAYIAEKENLGINIAATNKTQLQAATYAAASPVLGALNKQLGETLSGLKDLPPEVMSKILQFQNGSVGTSQARSQAISKLKSLNDSGSLKQGTVIDAKLSAALGIEGIAKADGSGGISGSDGKTHAIADLSQDQNSASNSANIENSYKFTQNDLARYLKSLPAETQLKVSAALDITKAIAQKNAELTAVGVPSFNIPQIGQGITDEYAKGRIQALQGEFNADMNKQFSLWAQEQLKSYPAGTSPKPSELEAAFARTPEYKDALKMAMARSNDIIKEKRTYASVSSDTINPGTTLPSVPVAAPSASQPKTKTGTAPPSMSAADKQALILKHGGR